MNTHKAKTAKVTVMAEADNALGTLSPHEELLLRLRFGIGGKRQSITVIARHFGVEPEDLHDLESRALSHLRHNALVPEHRA